MSFGHISIFFFFFFFFFLFLFSPFGSSGGLCFVIVAFLTFFDLHCTRMSLHACPSDFFFILDSRLANCFGKKTCHFGFLLV